MHKEIKNSEPEFPVQREIEKEEKILYGVMLVNMAKEIVFDLKKEDNDRES